MKSKLVFVAVFLLIISCDDTVKPSEKPACTLCDTLNRTGRIENRVSQFFIDWSSIQAGNGGLLAEFDLDFVGIRSGGNTLEYTTCNYEPLNKDELSEKIIRWSGFLHTTCDSIYNHPLVEIESYEIIHYCPKPWPELDFEPNIWNAQYEIASIQAADTLLYPPCEMMPPTRVGFYESSSKLFLIRAYVGANSYGLDAQMDWNDSTFVIAGGSVTDADASSYAVGRFEDAFNEVTGHGINSNLQLTINGPDLVLKNIRDQTSIKLKAVMRKEN